MVDSNLLFRDIICAASSAPFYFPKHQIKNSGLRNGAYLDGGIFANNPTNIALAEY